MLRRLNTHRSLILLVPAALFAAAVFGCGGDGLQLAPVEGIITLNGQPVADAGVMFVPVDSKQGPSAAGSTDQQGRFKLVCHNREGAPIGEHRVSISKADPFGDEVSEADLENVEMIRSRGLKPFKTKQLLPVAYSNVATSQLTASVEDKNNTFEFKLKSP